MGIPFDQTRKIRKKTHRAEKKLKNVFSTCNKKINPHSQKTCTENFTETSKKLILEKIKFFRNFLFC